MQDKWYHLCCTQACQWTWVLQCGVSDRVLLLNKHLGPPKKWAEQIRSTRPRWSDHKSTSSATADHTWCWPPYQYHEFLMSLDDDFPNYFRCWDSLAERLDSRIWSEWILEVPWMLSADSLPVVNMYSPPQVLNGASIQVLSLHVPRTSYSEINACTLG